MPRGAYRIEPVTSAPFDQVAYVLWKPDLGEALLIDPGFDWQGLLDVVFRHHLRPVAILNTHGHADHIAGNAALKDRFPDVPLLIGRAEAHMLGDPDANLSAPFGLPFTSPPADRLLAEGDRLELAGFEFDVREVAGHSPGCLVLACRGCEPPFAIVGDVLFQGSIGRADFPGGNLKALLEGIRTKLFDLPDETVVYPGHGDPTTIGRERRENPFVGESAGLMRP